MGCTVYNSLVVPCLSLMRGVDLTACVVYLYFPACYVFTREVDYTLSSDTVFGVVMARVGKNSLEWFGKLLADRELRV